MRLNVLHFLYSMTKGSAKIKNSAAMLSSTQHLMQRLLRIHCRGAPSSRIRPTKAHVLVERPFLPSKSILCRQFVHGNSGTRRKATFSCSSFPFPHIPRHQPSNNNCCTRPKKNDRQNCLRSAKTGRPRMGSLSI